MAQQVFYQTLNNLGVDPTSYVIATASVTPEYPAPPFLPGTQAFGSDGSHFVFVQASTSISLTDFVVVNIGTNVSPYMANSITSTNVTSSLAVGLGSTGIVVAGSLTYIPAGAYFWACTKGQAIPASTSAGLATNTSGVQLFTTATAGVLSSVTTSQSLAASFAGIITVNSLTVSIPSSIVAPAGGVRSNGYVIGPVVNLNNPRPVLNVASSTVLVAGTNLNIFSF
jgi:hypothetical protein